MQYICRSTTEIKGALPKNPTSTEDKGALEILVQDHVISPIAPIILIKYLLATHKKVLCLRTKTGLPNKLQRGKLINACTSSQQFRKYPRFENKH